MSPDVGKRVSPGVAESVSEEVMPIDPVEILTNKEKYPDDREITLADGEVVTVGQMRNSLQDRRGFTQANDQWKREKAELQSGMEALNKQLADALAAKAKDEGQPQPSPTRATTFSEEELLADPVVGPLLKRQKILEEKNEQLAGEVKLHRDTWLKNHFEAQIANISTHYNSTYNKDGKGDPFNTNDFLKFVEGRPISVNGTVDLGLCYQEYVRPKEIDRITREAEERGVERQKRARVPVVPFGRRKTPVRPEGVAEGADFASLTDEQIMNDPDMIAAARGEEE